jgi:hypothetical protein
MENENQKTQEEVISEEKKKEMSALEYDIKHKGENSYYYAHKGRFEEKKVDPNAKTITGSGIIKEEIQYYFKLKKEQLKIEKN